MERMVGKILRCYGQEIRIPRLGVSVWGFLQSVRGKGQHLVLKDVGPLGVTEEGQYVYIGPVEPELAEDEQIQLQGENYVVRRTELVAGPGGPAYRWAMCVKRGGDDLWGNNGSMM